MCLVASIFHAISSGAYFYGFSIFYVPILLEYGWSSAITAGAFSLSRLEGGLEAPFVGWLIDRYGVKKLMLLGVVLMGIGFIVMAKVENILLLYFVYAGLLSTGHSIGFRLSPTTLITKWFIKMRSRAMGIWSVAGGVGGAVLVPILAMSIVRFGWRNTAILMGFVILVTVLPLTLFVRNKPEDMGLLPDNLDPKLLEKTVEEDTEVDFITWEALKTKTFKYLIIAESLRSVLLSSLVVHQIPYLISIGVPQEAAAGILGLMITLSIPGRFVFGYLGDFFDMRKLIFLASVMQAVGVFIFAWMPGLMGTYTFVVIYGFAYGGIITVTASLRGKLFGRKRYATVTGILSPFQMIGSVIGPIFAGYIFDVYKDYRLAFYTFSVLALISAITYMLVKPEQPYVKLEKIQCA